MRVWNEFIKGFIKENPTFVLLLGMCPTLGTTTSAINGMSMGLAATVVLICSNAVISLLKNVIPDKVRIPGFIVVIASFVTVVDLSMQAYLPDLYETLGLFIPLIVVNCIILGRTEAFASKNNVLLSIADGLGIGLGFTMSLTILGSVREILGNGTVFDNTFFKLQVIPENIDKILLFIMPPGAFIALGFLIALVNHIKNRKAV